MKFLPTFLSSAIPYDTIGEKFTLVGSMLLRGIGTVFLVLALLWGIISLFGVFSAERKTTSKNKTAPVSEPHDADLTDTPDDTAVIAAICAAVEAYRADEGLATLHYKVVSYKRKSGKTSWTGNND